MKKRCSFEENKIEDFQIQEFQKIMQIQGLSVPQNIHTDLFPSVRHAFQKNNIMSIIGDGPNANIKSFYYLLLCHIRKQHCMKLLINLKKEQLQQSEQENFQVRDRRISFNDKGALFLRGPQYENYCLHKLKIFSFSKDIQFEIIQNSPFVTDKALYYQQKPLTSLMIKKILSQFLKEILPTKLQKDYKETFRSIQYYLNRHHCIGQIMTCLMRHILLSKYQVESARKYNEQINDHTLCTTLCDAFAIDGLLCRENQYQINTWCKVISVNRKNSKLFIVNISNDEFEQLGLNNDKKIQEMKFKYSLSNHIHSNNSGFYSQINSPTFNHQINDFQQSFKQSQKQKSQKSMSESSLMPSDQDSQMPDSSKCSTDRLNKVNNKNFHQYKNNNQNSGEQNRKISIQHSQNVNFIGLQQSSTPSFLTQAFKNNDINNDNFLNYIKDHREFIKKERESDKSKDCNMKQQKVYESISFKKGGVDEAPQKKNNIVNNNISNNIYLNVNSNDKPYLIPVINISTSIDKNLTQAFPCFNIKLS